MTKIYPKKIDDLAAAAAAAAAILNDDASSSAAAAAAAVVLTVWKKSLVLNWSGFAVFDTEGKLVYRVDNYMSSDHNIFLMDASGATLLTIRRKSRLTLLGDTWLLFQGEADADTINPRPPIFSVRKNLRSSRCLAHVSCGTIKKSKYLIEGSYGQRSCAVYDVEKRRRVAEITQKEPSVTGVALGKDVFRLVVHPGPGFDAALAMAIVILLDQMFGSH